MSIPTVGPSSAPSTSSAAVDPTCLGPAGDFPTDPTGPHPVTLDRHQELTVELRTRARRR